MLATIHWEIQDLKHVHASPPEAPTLTSAPRGSKGISHMSREGGQARKTSCLWDSWLEPWAAHLENKHSHQRNSFQFSLSILITWGGLGFVVSSLALDWSSGVGPWILYFKRHVGVCLPCSHHPRHEEKTGQSWKVESQGCGKAALYQFGRADC